MFANPLPAQWIQTGLPTTVVSVLAISGTNLFAGTDEGVFRSTNNGTSWTAVNTGLPTTVVSALAISDTNLFAGTYGSGVFRSTNNGTSWNAVNTGLTNTNVRVLAISGTNLFAGTDGGVFLSTNNGTSWTAASTGLTNTVVWSLAVSGTNLFAGTWGGGVFLSTNGGTSWTAASTGLTNSYVRALAVSGTNLFAGTTGGVFLSTNNGTSWTAASTGLTNSYVRALAVSGTNLFAGTTGGGVWRRPLSEITQGLVAYYPFNGNTNDESGNGNNGTLYGPTLTTDRFGNPNKAYSFNGTSDYIRVSDSQSLDIGDSLTITAWGYIPAISSGRIVRKINTWGPSSGGYILTGGSSGINTQLQLSTNPIGAVTSVTKDTALNLNEWYFIAMTYDGSTVSLFLNGSKIYSEAHTGAINLNNYDVYIGSSEGLEFFTGKIDDIRIYNRDLSDTEIQTIYHEGATLLLNTASISFGSVKVGQFKDTTIAITNTGNDTLKISNITSSNAVFSARPTTKDVPPSQSFTDTIRFAPIAIGTASGNILLYSNATSSPDTIQVSGNGFGTAALQLNTATVSFGSVKVGEFKDTTVTIANTGNDTLKISNVFSADTIFSGRPKALTIPPGTSANDTLRFKPSALGAVTGKLIVASNASSSSDTISVSGTGMSTLISFNAKTFSFGNVKLGEFKDTTVTITNTGNDTLRITNITSADTVFSVRPKVLIIAPGVSAKDTLRFKPVAITAVSGKLILTSNATSSPDTIIVSGTGISSTGVNELLSQIPKEYILTQNYPNPFNPATTISFNLPSKSFVSLKVFDGLGRELEVLLAEELDAGKYARQWNPEALPSGVYFYRLQAGSFTETKKLVLLR